MGFKSIMTGISQFYWKKNLKNHQPITRLTDKNQLINYIPFHFCKHTKVVEVICYSDHWKGNRDHFVTLASRADEVILNIFNYLAH